MKKMQKSTWIFTSICFWTSVILLVSALCILIVCETHRRPELIKTALETASVTQSVLVVYAVGSVIIEETAHGKGR